MKESLMVSNPSHLSLLSCTPRLRLTGCNAHSLDLSHFLVQIVNHTGLAGFPPWTVTVRQDQPSHAPLRDPRSPQVTSPSAPWQYTGGRFCTDSWMSDSLHLPSSCDSFHHLVNAVQSESAIYKSEDRLESSCRSAVQRSASTLMVTDGPLHCF